MSEAPQDARKGPHGPNQWRKARGTRISVAGLPSDEEVAQQTPQQRERFPLYTPEQIEMETATVQFRLTFEEPIHIRDQCEMIAEACRIIIAITRKHDLGSIGQRVQSRREARALSKGLVRFNGGYPRGVWKPKVQK